MCRRTVGIGLLVVALGLAFASPSPALPVSDPSLTAGGWAWLAQWLGSSKNGCTFDPFGWCAAGKKPTGNKNGCTADPFGRCIPVQASGNDNGCTFDPLGVCTHGEKPAGNKNGCRADPLGYCIN